jgi:hypothetical protein
LGWDEGLHTFKGMLGYCVKGNGEDHFEFVHHIASANDMNEGKMEYMKFVKVGLNNCVSLSHISLFAKGSSMGMFSYEEIFECILAGKLFHMCKSGQFYPI